MRLSFPQDALSHIDVQKNNFAALSVGNGRKRPIPSLLPCEMNFLCGRARSRVLAGVKPVPEGIANHRVASSWTRGGDLLS